MNDFNAINEMAHALAVGAVLTSAASAEDRALNPPDAPDAEPITEQQIAAKVIELKALKEEREDVCVAIYESPEFSDLIAIEEYNPLEFYHTWRIFIDEKFKERAIESLELAQFGESISPSDDYLDFAREQA